MQKAIDYKKKFDEISALHSSHKFLDALREVEDLLQQNCMHLSSYLLRQRAELIQLIPDDMSDEEPEWTIESAEENLRDSIILDPRSVDAYIELGYLTDAVMNNPRLSLTYFARAEALAYKYLEDAMLGKAKALEQIQGRESAFAELERLKRIFPDSKKISDFEELLRWPIRQYNKEVG